MKYSQSELVLLKYLDGFLVNNQLPNYFTNFHHLDTEKLKKQFLKRELLEVSSAKYILKRSTVAELQDFLKINGLSLKGNKNYLIYSILSFFNEGAIKRHFKNRYYVLTDKGKELLSAELNDAEYTSRYEFRKSISFDNFQKVLECVKQQNYTKAEALIKKGNGDPANNLSGYENYQSFIEYPFVLNIPDAKQILISMYMYSLRPEEVAKELNEHNINISTADISKAFRIIRAFDDLIFVKKSLAKLNNLPCHYIIRSMHDSKVCPVCSMYNNVKLSIYDAEVGATYPPFETCQCEYCRCFAEINLCSD